MAVYVLVAIVRKRLGLDISLYTLLQVLSVSLFEKPRFYRPSNTRKLAAHYNLPLTS